MRGDKARKASLERAKQLEASRDVEGAVRAYWEADAVMEAAALLARHARYAEAGRLLMRSLGVEPEAVGMLDALRRKRATVAASYFAKAKEVSTAVTLFVSLGQQMRAAEMLEQSGDLLGAQKLRDRQGRGPVGQGAQGPAVIGGVAVNREKARELEQQGKLDVAAQIYVQLKQFGDAGRVLVALGQQQGAADMFVKAGMPYEAAACYLGMGDTGKGLENLIRVARVDPRYRKASVEAIRVASELNVLSFQLEHFLTEFISPGPADEGEREAFMRLVELYERNDMPENAKEALAKVLARFPQDPGVVAKLQQMEQQTRRSSDIYRRIGAQDSGFTGEKQPGSADLANAEFLPGLPALPELPELPPLLDAPGAAMPGRAVPVAHVPSQLPATSGPGAPTLGPGPAGTHMGAGGSVGPSVAASTLGPDGAPLEQQLPVATLDGGRVASPEWNDPFAVGSTIAGRYRLEGKLGQGGMAVVFRALDTELDELIALKVFFAQTDDAAATAQSLARFKQELKLNRQLQHANILRLYDIGMDQGRRYISMELLVGICLDEVEIPLPPARALAYLVQACRGLQAAHDRDVIHRDIKPPNLFITEDDVVKVMDFGIAKGGSAGLTQTGMLAGTPRYIAPEQINDFGSVTPVADLYALGVVAYEMLTGRVPFDHDELMPLLMMHVNVEPQPMRELRPELPEELDAVVLKCLAKDPAARFASCSDLARALQRLRARLS